MSTNPWSPEVVNLTALRRIAYQHRGKLLAIKARELVAILGLGKRDSYPERSIRVAVDKLIELGCPIGSSVEKDHEGYFWVVTEDELQMCLHNYRARARAIERKAKQLEDAFRHGPRQGTLL